jgi:hypothetical protein
MELFARLFDPIFNYANMSIDKVVCELGRSTYSISDNNSGDACTLKVNNPTYGRLEIKLVHDIGPLMRADTINYFSPKGQKISMSSTVAFKKASQPAAPPASSPATSVAKKSLFEIMVDYVKNELKYSTYRVYTSPSTKKTRVKISTKSLGNMKLELGGPTRKSLKPRSIEYTSASGKTSYKHKF